jgi:hypothetical protein
MTESIDPIKILEDLNPVDREEVRGVARSSEARATLESILEQPATRSTRGRSRPHRRPRRLVAAAAIVLAAAMAGTAWALTRGAPQPITIGCYAAQHTTARTIVLPAGSGSAVATCRKAWQAGDFGAKQTPQLHACVLPSGGVAVFPGAQPCAHLKLRPLGFGPPSGGKTNRGSPTRLKNDLVRAYLHSRCLSRSRGLRLARSEIRRLDLRDWRAQVTTPFTSERSCASYAFDEQRDLVLIVPMPPR